MEAKQGFWARHRLTVQLISAVLMIVVGCSLLIVGFVTPPPGEIHHSVLAAFGEILTFAGACFGMDYRYRSKHQDKEEGL